MRTFVVKGRPVSINASNAAKLRWKQRVASLAAAVFPGPLPDDDLRIVITFYYNMLPDFDTDNISKPICDCLEGIAYRNDNQLMERMARRRDINGSFHIKGVPPDVAVSIAEGEDFVAITLEKVGEGVVVI